MKWAVTTPPADPATMFSTSTPGGGFTPGPGFNLSPVSPGPNLLAQHLRLDADNTDSALLALYLDAAVDYAQDAMATSLLSQTITAQFYIEDARNEAYTPYFSPFSIGTQWDSALCWNRQIPSLLLPRGPVSGIVSVTDGLGNNVTNFALTKVGTNDRLWVKTAYSYPLTIVYTAGYADGPSVPAAIRVAILAHVGTLYARRESVTDKALMTVPHSLKDFYALKSRRTPVG